MPDNQVSMSPAMFVTCIIVSILVGAAISYVAMLAVKSLSEPKKTMVLRDGKGRLEGIIET